MKISEKTGPKTPGPAVKKYALFLIDKVDGQNRYNINHKLRESDDSLIYKTGKPSFRSYSTKRSVYKTKPYEKFIVLPPEYKLGNKELVQPIRSSFENFLIFKNPAGSLVVPKQSFLNFNVHKTASPRDLDEISLNRKVKALNLRIKELSAKLHPALGKNLRLASKSRIISDDLKSEWKEKTLSPNQLMLLKKFDERFNHLE